MDRVRFGRALGYGARHAAKTLMAAAEAAAAPKAGEAAPASAQSHAGRPSPQQNSGQAQRRAPSPTPRPTAPHAAAAVRAQASQTGKSMASSVKRFSGAVLLQVVGSFFALFAVTFGGAVWRLRAAFQGPQNTPEAHKLYAASLVCVVFAYFAVSSFLRARRLENA